MASVTLNINGVDRTIDDIDPSTPLLWALRDHLGLVGTKYSCGVGECGSCMVLLDGAPLPSCLVSVDSLAGEAITTIEGIAEKDGSLHPVQEAWIEHDVAQCGYCQSGQIVAAVALLKSNPKPSDDDIKSAMSDNLCRCGTYKRIHEAIKTASKGGAA
ncbi:MAG: (2Fe-2S)-binding protein [Puniceicoccaceae bacterium]